MSILSYLVHQQRISSGSGRTFLKSPQQRQALTLGASWFRQKLQLPNSKFLLHKFTAVFSFRHIVFFQVGFVTAFVLAAWLRLDKVIFCCSKKGFKFCCSYFFLVFAFYFFCCCGVGQWVEASALFGCCWLVLFLVAGFHFMPQVVVLLFFSYSFRWTIWLSVFSKNSF